MIKAWVSESEQMGVQMQQRFLQINPHSVFFSFLICKMDNNGTNIIGFLCELREIMYLKAYSDAQEAFNKW